LSDGTSREVDLMGDLHGQIFEPLADPAFFAQVRVDDELGTAAWPNGADLDPLLLHGDFEPATPPVPRADYRLPVTFMGPPGLEPGTYRL
jgi:hypothetical protein